MHAQKEFEKTSGVHASSRQPTKMCVMKMKETHKRRARKNVIDGRRHFIGCIRKTGENNLDKLQSGHSEGTICLVNG